MHYVHVNSADKNRHDNYFLRDTRHNLPTTGKTFMYAGDTTALLETRCDHKPWAL